MQNTLSHTTNAVDIALQRMSTGYKINTAKDDAAGMFVATNLFTQTNGLKVAENNVETGISLLQTAEGAFSNAIDILNRLRDLSVQSSNGFYSSESKEAMQREADELLKQLSQIQTETNFNGLKLFDEQTQTGANAAAFAILNSLNTSKALSGNAFSPTGGGC